MTELNQRHCEACTADATIFSEQQALQLLPQLPEWQIVERDQIPRLWRRYRFSNFVDALAFTNRVAEMAEQQGHHPDLLTSWGSVEVHWWSHKLKGLHNNDFVCAARSDQLYQL